MKAVMVGSTLIFVIAVLVVVAGSLGFLLSSARSERDQAIARVGELQSAEKASRGGVAGRRGDAGDLFRTMVESTNAGICIVDAEERLVYANAAFADIVGKDIGDLVGESLAQVLEPSEFEKMRERTHSRLDNLESSVYEAQVIGGYAEARKVLISASPLASRDGGPGATFGIVVDITERCRHEKQLWKMAGIFDQAIEGIVITDADGTITRVNRAFTDITGYSTEEAIGRNPRILKSDRHDADFYRRMWESLGRDGQWSGEIWNRRKSGEAFPEWLSITSVKDADGAVSHYVSVFRDISEHKRSEEQLTYQANHDALTGLPNRYLFDDRLAGALARARRLGTMVAVLFLDMDNFKQINDRLGHPAGDVFLQEVARRLFSCIRDGDTVARLGGDEFVVLLPDLDGREHAMNIVRRIDEMLTMPFSLAQQEVNSSASIGVAFFPDHGEDGATLLNYADTAMYETKEHGKSGFTVFSGGQEETGSTEGNHSIQTASK